jgi:hypothetical protein
LEAFFKEFSEGFAHDDFPELRGVATPAGFKTQPGLLSRHIGGVQPFFRWVT